jgi:hypothetical protein
VSQAPSSKPHEYAYAFKIKLSGDVGDNMIAGRPFTMAEESMTYDEIDRKHFAR